MKNICTIKSIRFSGNYEFLIEGNGHSFWGILGVGEHSNWISFPGISKCCELAHLSDTFWNREQLNLLFSNSKDVDVVLHLIHTIHSYSEAPSELHFEGHSFVSNQEYIFWLECECESLSRQLAIYDDEAILSKEQLHSDRHSYYLSNRDSYNTSLE